MTWRIAVSFILFVQVFGLFSFAQTQETSFLPDSYLNKRFWEIEVNRCYFWQKTENSCVSASIQMVLAYLDFSPLPSQTHLAAEMHTDVNHTTKWRYTYIPFKNRRFSEYYNHSLSNDFNIALSHLRGNISQNFPAMIKIWYDEQAKAEGKITHACVVTGYNSTGIFFHDPWHRPNRFLNYSAFSSLWETDSGYWAFIVKQEPKFDLIVEAKDWFGTPIPEVELVLRGETNRTEVTDLNGTATFTNLTMADYVLSCDWRFQSEEYKITFSKTTKVSCGLFFSNQTILIMAILPTSLVIVAAIVWILKKRA
jgi:hypothetical protein